MVTEQPIGGFRGLYEAISPIERPPGALSAVSNLVINPSPALTTRPGLTLAGTAVGTDPVRGIHPFYNTVSGTSQLLAHFGVELHKYDEVGGSWGASIGALAAAGSTSAMLNDLLLIFDGTNQKKWDGTTLAALGGTPPAGKYVISAYEQLFVAGIAARPADVDFCDVAAPEVWTPAPGNDAGSISVAGAREGDYITWLGFDKVQGQVIFWTRYGLVVLTGPETPNRPALWSPRVVSPHGTPNGRTVQNMDGTWIWLTDRGFARWNGGDVAIDLNPIRDTFNTIDWANIANACAWLDVDRRYCCAVPVTGGGTVHFYFDGSNWFTGSGKIIRASGSYRFSGKETPLAGDNAGSVYKVLGDDDAGTAIAWSAVVGPSMFGASAYKKELVRVTPVMSLASGGTASAAVSGAESGAFGTARSVAAGTGITQVGIPLLPSRSGIFRVKLSGTGKATIHDIVLEYRRAGR